MSVDGNTVVAEYRRPSLTLFVVKVSGDFEIDAPPTAFMFVRAVAEDLPTPSLLV